MRRAGTKGPPFPRGEKEGQYGGREPATKRSYKRRPHLSERIRDAQALAKFCAPAQAIPTLQAIKQTGNLQKTRRARGAVKVS
jgi:hypothetical protein